MSRPADSAYAGSTSETADSDRGVATQAHPADAELAQAPPAEPRSRSDYAIHMRQGPAGGDGDQGTAGTADRGDPGGDDNPAGTRQPATTGDQPPTGDHAGHAQGMTRGQYADHMRQGPATGQDHPQPASTSPGGETDATHPGNDTDASQTQGTSQATADLDPAGQPAETLAPSATTTDNGASTQDGPDAAGEPSGDDSPPAGPRPGQQAPDNRSATGTVSDQPEPAGTSQAPAGPEATPDAQATTDHSADAQPGQPERPGSPEADAGKPASPEADRLKALEAENAQARQKITELEEKNNEQAARLDHIEQFLASTDRHPGSRSGPGHDPDQPGTAPDQGTSIGERKGSRQTNDAKRAEPSRLRRAVSAENIGAAGTVISAADTIAQFAMHATPDGVVGLATTVLGLAALGLAKIEKRRKEKDNDRPDKPQA